MSRNTKIVLAVVVGAVLVLCLCACALVFLAGTLFINNSVTTGSSVRTVVEEAVQVDPRQLNSAGEIAALTLPSGWRSDYSVKVGGFRLAGYRPENGTGHITLVALPETSHTSIEDLEGQARGFADSYGYTWNKTEMKVVDRKPINIRGQATEMVVAEGTGSSGPWRQAMVSFRGDQGLTLVIYGMPQASYDQAVADVLFASIR